jgi:hypothetical protein
MACNKLGIRSMFSFRLDNITGLCIGFLFVGKYLQQQNHYHNLEFRILLFDFGSISYRDKVFRKLPLLVWNHKALNASGCQKVGRRASPENARAVLVERMTKRSKHVPIAISRRSIG